MGGIPMSGRAPPLLRKDLLEHHRRSIDFILRDTGNIPLSRHVVHVCIMASHENNLQPTIQELVAATRLPRSTVSRHVGELVRCGLIREQADPQDRRRRILLSAAKGKQKRREFLAALRNSAVNLL